MKGWEHCSRPSVGEPEVRKISAHFINSRKIWGGWARGTSRERWGWRCRQKQFSGKWLVSPRRSPEKQESVLDASESFVSAVVHEKTSLTSAPKDLVLWKQGFPNLSEHQNHLGALFKQMVRPAPP